MCNLVKCEVINKEDSINKVMRKLKLHQRLITGWKIGSLNLANCDEISSVKKCDVEYHKITL